jgi:hypothetical protein
MQIALHRFLEPRIGQGHLALDSASKSPANAKSLPVANELATPRTPLQLVLSLYAPSKTHPEMFSDIISPEDL